SQQRAARDARDLGARQPKEEHLKHREQDREREHREHDASRRADDVREERRVAHWVSQPISRMTMIGPIDATPSRPNASFTADRPAITELTPNATASTTGPVSAPVVTLPASYASGATLAGARNVSTIITPYIAVSFHSIENP